MKGSKVLSFSYAAVLDHLKSSSAALFLLISTLRNPTEIINTKESEKMQNKGTENLIKAGQKMPQ